MAKSISNHPKTGFRAAQWRVLLATMFCYLFYYTGRQTLGFAIPGIEAELGLSKKEIGWMITGLLWAYAMGQAVNGNLGDKFGGRRMMSLGAVLSCGFNWMVSFGTSFTGLLMPWVANGFSQSMGWAPGSRVLSNWWGHHERGKAFGFYVFAAGMSSVLAFVSSLIILDVLSLNWRWIFRLPVLLLLVGGLAYYLIVRDRPEDLGFQLDEDDANHGQGEEKVAVGETSLQRYMAVLSNWRFMIASIGIGFQSSARYGLIYWVPVHFLGADWKNSDAKWISIALPVGMALGALTGGWVSDRVFNSVRWKLYSTFLILAAVASFAMFFIPRDHWAGILFLFFCGFFAYGSQAGFWPLAPDLLGSKRAGTGVGVMNFFAYLFAGLVNPLIGWVIISNNENTALVFPIVAVACVAGAITGLFVRR